MKRAWLTDRSKLNKMELTKLNKDGLDIFNDIENYAKLGFEAITPDDLDLLKWAGIYTQKPRTAGYFLLRVKVPGGIMNSEQARALAGIARDYGRNCLDLTTRQAVQFHWLRIENLPDIFARLAQASLTSTQACGDCSRTIVGNPLAGIDPNELFDAGPVLQEVQQFFQNNRDFSNLPRKFKISISASKFNAGHAEINDLAFTPAVKEINGEEIQGFHVMVGGGLSAKPHLGQKLDIFVRPGDALKVAIGVATIFRDYGYREQRNHARLKFLVADWGPEKFCAELLKLTGPLPTRGVDMTLGWNGGYFYGVHTQKQPGLNYLGLAVPVGRLDSADMEELARIADQYGNGSIRTSNSKHVILPNVPDAKVKSVLGEKLLQRLTPFPKAFAAYCIACTGNEFCNLALVETKQRMRLIAEYLDQHLDVDAPVRIHLTGCPNSCGQLHIADIGLRGAVLKAADGMKEAFEISLGGGLGPKATFNTKLAGRFPADNVAKIIESLVRFFQENKRHHESFGEFVQRVGIPAFQARLNEFANLTLCV